MQENLGFSGIMKTKSRSIHSISAFSKFGRVLAQSRSFKPRRRIRRPISDSSDKYANDVKAKENSLSAHKGEGDIQVDFVFSDPKAEDYHSVKTLFNSYLDNTEWDLSGFVELLLEQTRIGSVVKIEDNEDDGAYAFVSAVNIGRHMSKNCIVQVRKFIARICPENSLVLPWDKVGLIVSQRVVNLPYQLLPPLYDALFDEISWATEDEPTDELRNSFRFESYLIISKVYKIKKTVNRNSDDDEFVYVKVEDEIFLKHCSWHVFFPLSSAQDTVREMKNYRPMGIIMLMDANKIAAFRRELHSFVG